MAVIGTGFNVDKSSQITQPFASPNPIAVGTSPIKLMDFNECRKEVVIQNTGTTVLAIKLAPNPNYAVGDFHVLLSAGTASRDGSGGIFVSDTWQGQIWIVSSAPGGECVIAEEI